ncbi:unnamed protein product, partial [Ectocarpus fasciculatus]
PSAFSGRSGAITSPIANAPKHETRNVYVRRNIHSSTGLSICSEPASPQFLSVSLTLLSLLSTGTSVYAHAHIHTWIDARQTRPDLPLNENGTIVQRILYVTAHIASGTPALQAAHNKLLL